MFHWLVGIDLWVLACFQALSCVAGSSHWACLSWCTAPSTPRVAAGWSWSGTRRAWRSSRHDLVINAALVAGGATGVTGWSLDACFNTWPWLLHQAVRIHVHTFCLSFRVAHWCSVFYWCQSFNIASSASCSVNSVFTYAVKCVNLRNIYQACFIELRAWILHYQWWYLCLYWKFTILIFQLLKPVFVNVKYFHV